MSKMFLKGKMVLSLAEETLRLILGASFETPILVDPRVFLTWRPDRISGTTTPLGC